MSALIARFDVLARAVLLLAIAIGIAIVVSSATETKLPTRQDWVDVLVGLGAMCGGVLAIVFALSSFVQQNAAELYSSQFYEVYARDSREKVIFGLISGVAVAAFGGALFQSAATQPLPSRLLVYIVMIAIAAVLVLVDWQHKIVTRKINPLAALQFLETQSLRSLRNAHRFAQDAAEWLRVHNEGLTEQHSLALSYDRYARKHLDQVDQQLDSVIEISLRLATRGEFLATQRGLAAVHAVVAKYLEFRRDSSLVVASGYAMLAVESDSQKFLSRSFERINEVAERLMATGQSRAALFVFDLYAAFVPHAKELTFLNRPWENPVLDQLRAYFSGVLDSAIRRNDVEMCFRSITVSQTIGLAVIEKKLHAATMNSVYGDLSKVAMWAIGNKTPVFVEKVTEAMVSLLAKSVEEDVPSLDTQLPEALDRIRFISLTLHRAGTAGLIPRIGATFVEGKAYVQLEPALVNLVNAYVNRLARKEKQAFGSNLLELYKQLWRSLQSLAEEARSADAPLVFNVASLIDGVVEQLIHLARLEDEAKNLARRDEFEKLLKQFLYLPGWYVHYAQTLDRNYAFETLAEVAPKAGLRMLAENMWPTVSEESAKAAFSIVKNVLEKGDRANYYDEPRLMMGVSYIGVMAQKTSNARVLSSVIQMIRQFEELYRLKYFADGKVAETVYGPSPDQLSHEFLKWRNEYVHGGRFRMNVLDHPRDIVLQFVDDTDVDRFIFKVWRIIPPHSRIEEELTTPSFPDVESPVNPADQDTDK